MPCFQGFLALKRLGECPKPPGVGHVYREDSSEYTEPENRESQSTHAVSKAVAA
jgi:hypothetical protein